MVKSLDEVVPYSVPYRPCLGLGAHLMFRPMFDSARPQPSFRFKHHCQAVPFFSVKWNLDGLLVFSLPSQTRSIVFPP